MGTLIFGLLILAIVIFLGGLQEMMKAKVDLNQGPKSFTTTALNG